MRKILSLILALSIICSLAIAPVWADDEEGDGTVDPYAAPLSAPNADVIEGKASNYAKTKTRLEGFVAGGYIVFKNINFDRQPSKIDYHVGLGSNLRTNLEFRLDSPTGSVVAVAPVKLSNWSKGATQTIEITEKVKGVHDLYIITTDSTIHFYKFQFYTDEVIKYISPNLKYDEVVKYSDIADSPYYNDIITALDLELIDEYASKEFKPQLPITRYEFAKTVASIMNLSPVMDNYFSDVTPETPNYNEINAVRASEYLKGVSETEFAPYDYIKPFDAAVVAIRMLGYEHMATLKGGYPVGYKLMANELGLMDGLDEGDVLRRDTFARWIKNVIDSTYADITSITNGASNYENIKGLLSKTRKINKGVGVVTANHFGSIYSATGGSLKNFVNIEGIPYYCENTYASAYLGMKVDFYYIERNGRYEIISVVPSTEADFRDVSDKKMKTLDNTGVVYYTDASNTKTATLKTDSKTVFIVNGKAIDESIKNIISPEDFKGQILWADNDRNHIADVVIIWAAQTYELNTISQNKLADRVNSSANKKLTPEEDTYIDISDADMIYHLNGEEVKKADIPMGSIAQVFESQNKGRKVVRVYVMDDPVSGTVTEILDDGVVCIGGKEYKTDIKLELNNTGSFYVDKYNHIVYFKEGVNADNKTGLFIGAAKSAVGAFGEQKFEIKLYTADGEIAIYEVYEKALIDGKRLNKTNFTFNHALNGDGTYEGLLVNAKNSEDLKLLNTPVVFRLNAENKITFIDTLLKGAEDENDTIKSIKSGTFYTRINPKLLTVSSEVTYDYPYDDVNNIFFRIYSGADGTDIADYTTTTITKYGNNKSTGGSTTLYSSKGNFITDILVRKNMSKVTSTTFKQAFFVSLISEGLNKEGEPAIKLTGIINNGQSKAYIISNEAYEATTVEKDADGNESIQVSNLKLIIDNIKRGDIIRPKFNTKSEIADADLIFSNDAKMDNGAGIVPKLYEDKEANKKSAYNTPAKTSAGFQDIFGIIEERVNGFLKVERVTSTEDKRNYEYFVTTGKTVIVYDCLTGDYKRGTEADLEAGEYVVVSTTNMVPDSIVIYKNLFE